MVVRGASGHWRSCPVWATLKTAGDSSGREARRGQGVPLSLGRLKLEGSLRGQAEALAGAALPRLASLDLDGCGLRNADLAALVGADLFANLRVLSLRNNAIGDRGVTALAKSPAQGAAPASSAWETTRSAGRDLPRWRNRGRSPPRPL